MRGLQVSKTVGMDVGYGGSAWGCAAAAAPLLGGCLPDCAFQGCIGPEQASIADSSYSHACRFKGEVSVINLFAITLLEPMICPHKTLSVQSLT